MRALIRTIAGWLLIAIVSRLAVVLTRLHERTPQRLVSRRSFLRNTVLGSVGVVLLQAIGGFVYFFWPNKTGAFGKEIPVPLDVVPPVGEDPYRHQAGKFFIINNEEGALALYWKCVHLGCTVPWDEGRGEFVCPCHGSVYNRYGERVAGPAPRALDLMPIRIEGNNVIVDTNPENLIIRQDFEPEQAVPISV